MSSSRSSTPSKSKGSGVASAGEAVAAVLSHGLRKQRSNTALSFSSSVSSSGIPIPEKPLNALQQVTTSTHTGLQDIETKTLVATARKGSSSSSVSVIMNEERAEIGTNEKILNEIYALYKSKYGIIKTAKMLNVESQISKPQHKITVLLLGNHSAGKSSFINWYIQEQVLKTGVAMETQGINLIVSGSKRETLKGLATLEVFPHLKKLKKIPGVVDNLVTEISCSRSRNFDLINFIDTPGLVDGNMNYPFDINKTLVALGETADLIFVFFEPIGQALCKRTLNILEEMWSAYGDGKIRLYLAKADEAGGDKDRQRVLMQIVQELCKRPGINRTGFDMPAIYIPPIYTTDLFSKKGPRCANQIDETCKEIDRAVGMNVQNALDSLKKDCQGLFKKLEKRIDEDSEAKQRNSDRWKSRMLRMSLVVLFIAFVLTSWAAADGFLDGMLVDNYRWITMIMLVVGKPVADFFALFPEHRMFLVSAVVGLPLILLYFAGSVKREEVMAKSKREEVEGSLGFVEKALKKQTSLYKNYLKQSLPSNVEIMDEED